MTPRREPPPGRTGGGGSAGRQTRAIVPTHLTLVTDARPIDRELVIEAAGQITALAATAVRLIGRGFDDEAEALDAAVDGIERNLHRLRQAGAA